MTGEAAYPAAALDHRDAPVVSDWRGRLPLSAVLVGVMAATMFTTGALSVLAPDLLADFDMGRGELGLVLSIGTIGGGLVSPLAGRLIDRLGARRALVAVFTTVALSNVLFAAAHAYAVLLAGGLVAAVALGGANPTTNEIILQHLPPGQRGTMTGLKQSGAPFGAFLAGLTVPAAAAAIGWRGTLVVLTVLSLAAIPFALRATPARVVSVTPAIVGPRPTRTVEYALGVGALLTGLANSALFLVPLYAVEELGVGSMLGGVASSAVGLAAVVGRVLWARAAEANGRAFATLQLVSVGGMLGFAITSAAGHGGGWWVLALGAVVVGVTTSSWISVAQLAVMGLAASERTGAASGTVMMGFYLGLGFGPPLHGLLVDHTGRYDLAWLGSIACAGLAALVVRSSHRARRR